MNVLTAIVAAALLVVDFATNSVSTRISSANPSVCLSRFVDYPPSKGKFGFPRCLWEKPFSPNERFWLKDVDFSCASPWNDESGSLRAGTLISKRHVIFAKHFPLWRGCRIYFVGQDGEACPCRVEATKAVGKTDILIGSLDCEVTPNIHPAKILPANYAKYIGDGAGLPIVTFDQYERAVVTEVRSVTTKSVMDIAIPRVCWRAFGSRIVTGDSGNPSFLLIGKEPVLIFCVHTGGLVGTGPSIHYYRREIQAAMDELCPGYKLEEFDFAAFISAGKGGGG